MGNDISINKQKRWESNMGNIRGNKDKKDRRKKKQMIFSVIADVTAI